LSARLDYDPTDAPAFVWPDTPTAKRLQADDEARRCELDAIVRRKTWRGPRRNGDILRSVLGAIRSGAKTLREVMACSGLEERRARNAINRGIRMGLISNASNALRVA
jgi:hypothetical protein